MKDTDYIDDQMLGAFVDGELDAPARATILRALEDAAELRDRVYRLRRAKDLMKLGFDEARPPTHEARPQSRGRSTLPLRLAASFAALAISFGAGMLFQQLLEQRPGQGAGQLAAQQEPAAERVILHVSQSDHGLFLRALDYTERFMREPGAGREIAVVAHASGLDLMRADVSPLRDRITRLMQQHANVHFVACASAISMLREKGTIPQIIRGVSTDTTAFDHIVHRLQDGGWRYIKADSLPAT